LKKEGDQVAQGEVIAEAKSLFGLLTSRATATLEGTVESISGVTGQVVLRGPPNPLQSTPTSKAGCWRWFPTRGWWSKAAAP
ncbi:MAG: hypothetical protein OXU26_14510, partial [Acidobacteriota bacterium]|nr:hypothetical protein [Acidobacteriota bacterium]